MRARVYQPPSGPVRVLRPNPRTRSAGESEAAHLARMAEATEAADPSLAGLPWLDLDDADLPPRADRARWRLVGGAVVVRAREGAVADGS